MIVCLFDLHDRGLFHGDVKLQNYLLTHDSHVALTDLAFYKPHFLEFDDL